MMGGSSCHFAPGLLRFEFIDQFLESVGFKLVALKGISSLLHKLDHVKLVFWNFLPTFFQFFLSCTHPHHLIFQLLPVVDQSSFAFMLAFPVGALGSAQYRL